MITKKVKWEKTHINNLVLKTSWGGISYNPNTLEASPIQGEITNLINALDPSRQVSDGKETALYTKDDNKFRVLTGDFRKEYEKVFPSKKKCLEVYQKNIKYRNNYSTD